MIWRICILLGRECRARLISRPRELGVAYQAWNGTLLVARYHTPESAMPLVYPFDIG
jgi:hypothetical protein